MQLLINTEQPQSVIHGTFEQVLACGLLLRGKTKRELAQFLKVTEASVHLYFSKGFPEKHRMVLILKFLNAELITIPYGNEPYFTLLLK